jgi:hypothetical protein
LNAKRPPEGRPLVVILRTIVVLIDHLDDSVASRIDQHGPVVHDRIAVLGRAILSRHCIICYTSVRQHGSDLDSLAIVR